MAEADPRGALQVNVVGAANILDASARCGVERIVLASTGKAFRYYTDDVYAGSKKALELLAHQQALRSGPAVSVVRFTHIVDNSIIFRRLQQWTLTNSPIGLHSAAAGFYAQSALEAAELLIDRVSCPVQGAFEIATQRNLGWPIDLLSLAEDVRTANRSSSPIEVVGYEAGYEEVVHPAAYDPMTAGCCSPLINGIEASQLGCCQDYPYDVVIPPPLELSPERPAAGRLLRAATARSSVPLLRSLLQAVVLEQLRHQLITADSSVLDRAIRASAHARNDHPTMARITQEFAREGVARRGPVLTSVRVVADAEASSLAS